MAVRDGRDVVSDRFGVWTESENGGSKVVCCSFVWTHARLVRFESIVMATSAKSDSVDTAGEGSSTKIRIGEGYYGDLRPGNGFAVEGDTVLTMGFT